MLNIQQSEGKGVQNSAFLELSLWKQLQHSTSLQDFSEAWLALQSGQIVDLQRSMIMLESDHRQGQEVICFWPNIRQNDPDLSAVCDIAITEKRIVVRELASNKQENPISHGCQVAVPILWQGKGCGAVAVVLSKNENNAINFVIRQLQWGVTWIELFFRRSRKFAQHADEHLNIVLHLLACCVDNAHFQAAATQVVTELCSLLECERVSLGFIKGERIHIAAISNTAQFNKKTNLVAKISAVMEEAVDQQATLVYPAPQQDSTHKTVYAHSKAADEFNSSICTAPLVNEGKIFGALCMQRTQEHVFEPETVELCEIISTLIGPILELKKKEEQWLLVKFLLSIRAGVVKLLGTGHLTYKVSFILLVAMIVFFTVADGDYRVSADARLEGAIHRAVVAPFDGYISESHARAGDLVNQGQILAKLDDRDIVVERMNWLGKKNQYAEQYRDALAKFEPAEIQVMKTKLGQAKAEIALLDEMLKRTLLKAPFDGIVVSGDLSQLMGSPVSKGEVLFEIAPLDAYRVILEVDESDIRELKVRQQGLLVLTGKSDMKLPFQVEKITPVAEQREGRNYFRVEALLNETPPLLRPGMKGVGKIEIGSRKLIWIWTHSLVDWLRLWWWNWWP